MAAGEYVSVSSQADTERADLARERRELATAPADLPRYTKDGYELVTPAFTAKLDQLVREVEAQKVSFRGWATPGANARSATLDVARTIETDPVEVIGRQPRFLNSAVAGHFDGTARGMLDVLLDIEREHGREPLRLFGCGVHRGKAAGTFPRQHPASGIDV